MERQNHLRNQQLELWIGLVEFRPFDREAYGAAGAFSYIVTWACDAAEFRKTAETIAATLELYVLGVERERPLAKWLETESPREEIEDMIQRAETNPNAIVYGTFHRYRVDQG
jgi:hypothetical protein